MTSHIHIHHGTVLIFYLFHNNKNPKDKLAVRAFTSRYGGTISWFPGHMAAAQDKVATLVSSCDIVLEVRDARLPFTSAHPGLAALCSTRPRIVVFNKSDLACDAMRHRVVGRLKEQGLPCLFTSAASGVGGRAPRMAPLLALVDAMPTRASRFRAAGTVLAVVGMPNVGKSSIINALKGATKGGRGKAGVAPTPGFTRGLATIRIREDPPLFLADTPGVMMPRLVDVETGLKLAVSHSLKDTVVPHAVQAEYLLYAFANTGFTGYVEALGLSKGYSEDEVVACLEDLAGRLGALKGGGVPDTDAAAIHMVRAFQLGRLGKHTLDFIAQ